MREFLRAKIHNVSITSARLEYEGSFGIDAAILKKLDILPYESIEIYNKANGARLRTYAIALPEGSGRFESNGAAAHLLGKGHRVIIACYTRLKDEEIISHKPKIVLMDENNQIKEFKEPSVTSYSHYLEDSSQTDSLSGLLAFGRSRRLEA